jgi:hypothetical protein
MTRRIGSTAPPQRLQTRRVIRRPPSSAFKLFCAGHTAGRRAGVFCASETESTPDTTAELPAWFGNGSPPQRLQTRRVIRRPPSSPSTPFFRRTHPPYDGPTVGRVCSARLGPNSPQTSSQNYPPDWERRITPTPPNRRVIRRSPASPFKLFLRRTHPPYDGPAVGRVCSARARSKPPQTPPQNYPPDWERLATPTLPNQAGNPASTSLSIQAFFCAGHTRPTMGQP